MNSNHYYQVFKNDTGEPYGVPCKDPDEAWDSAVKHGQGAYEIVPRQWFVNFCTLHVVSIRKVLKGKKVILT